MEKLASENTKSTLGEGLDGFLTRVERALQCADCPQWMWDTLAPELKEIRAAREEASRRKASRRGGKA